MRKTLAIALCGALTASCASTPPVSVSYYLPKAETQLLAAQTLGCNAAGTMLVVATSVTPTTSYAANAKVKESLSFADLSGTFADADASVNFTSDGRLSGINTTSTGEGETIIKNAITLTSTIAGGGLYAEALVKDPVKSACEAITAHSIPKIGADGKPQAGSATVTLTYGSLSLYDVYPCKPPIALGTIRLADNSGDCISLLADAQGPSPQTADFVADADSAALYKTLSAQPALTGLGPSLTLVSATVAGRSADMDAGKHSTSPQIMLNDIATVALDVTGLTGELLRAKGDVLERRSLWDGMVRVPLTDDKHVFALPIPKTEFFGKTQFALSLNADGSISKLEYGATNGSGDALATLSTVAQAARGPTNAQQAAALQAQSDVIYQQQRLVLCETNPKNCPSK